MTQTFNTIHVIIILYIVIAILTILKTIEKHNWFEGLTLILGLFWPIYLFALTLVTLFDDYYDRKKQRKIRKQNFFTDTHEGKLAATNKGIVVTKGKGRAIPIKNKNDCSNKR